MTVFAGIMVDQLDLRHFSSFSPFWCHRCVVSIFRRHWWTDGALHWSQYSYHTGNTGLHLWGNFTSLRKDIYCTWTNKYTTSHNILIFAFTGSQKQNQATPETKEEPETNKPTELDPRADPENQEPAGAEPESSANRRSNSYSQVWRSQSQSESGK